MKMVLIEPYNIRSVIKYDGTLEQLQDLVGGYVEAIYQSDGTVLLVNEEGKLQDLPINIGDLCGNILILRVKGDDFTGLTDKDIKKYMEV